MERIQQNKSFLDNLLKEKGNRLRSLLSRSSEENIKCIVELVINSKHFKFTGKEKRNLTRSKSLLKYFKSKRILKQKILRRHLIKNLKQVKIFVSLVLPKAYELSLICMYEP
jgi:hypothetical protein